MTDDEIWDEIKRELAMRRSVYPRWIQEGKLDAGVAAHRIGVFVQLDQEFKRRCDRTGDLFGGQ